MSERIDAVDKQIMLAMLDGSKWLRDLCTLTGLKYVTLRQRLKKLIKYGYVDHSEWGQYALTDKGKRFVEELSVVVKPNLKAPKLKKLIDMLPTELHRAFFRLLLSGIIAKYHLFDVFDDGYPAFILGGETSGFKTALAKVVCRLLGLKWEENSYNLFSAIAGEFGVRRFRVKGDTHYSIAVSPFFKEPFVCLDELDKVTDRDTRRNVLYFLDGKVKSIVEGQLVENHVCTMVTLNTKIGKGGIARFGIPVPYIRRCIVADVEHVRGELEDVDLVADKILDDMKDFPRIYLSKLRLVHTKLTKDVSSRLRNLLMNSTDKAYRGLIDKRPLVILTLGRSALLDGDVREAMYQTIYDRLICLESLGGTVAGWRENVGKEWAEYKRDEQPEIEAQHREAAAKRIKLEEDLKEREGKLEQKRQEQDKSKYDFLLQRGKLGEEIKAQVRKIQRKHREFVDPLTTLRRNVKKSQKSEDLERYRVIFEDLVTQIVPILEQEEKQRKELEARKAQRKEEKRRKNKQIKPKVAGRGKTTSLPTETKEPFLESRSSVDDFLDKYPNN